MRTDLFSVEETTGFNIFLRSRQGLMKSGAVICVEPVARIERQKIYFSSLGESRRLVHE